MTIEDYIRTTADPMPDFVLLDTWCGTNEGTWWDTVMPLRRMIQWRWGKWPIIHCWAEDIMAGQIVPSLTMGKPHWYYKHLPSMTTEQAEAFVTDVGTRSWEKKYGQAINKALIDMGTPVPAPIVTKGGR
jgi:hypothetical protein